MKLIRTCFPLVIVGVWFLAGCATTSTPSSSEEPRNANQLRVGVAPVLPPLAFKADSEFKGVEPDLARALAADLGKTVKFVEVPWEGLIDALLNGKVDIIMSGMTITQERLMRINFSKPYLRSGQSILVRRTDAALIQMTLFEPKTRVGAQKGTTGDYWVKQNCFRSDRKLYSTASQGARALVSKSLDAFVCDAPVNWWLASENESAGLTVVGGYLTEEFLGWGIRRDDPKLLEAANQFVDRSREDGRLQSIIQTWIPYK
jgi:polar amino acid transport system substrate-binding protein